MNSRTPRIFALATAVGFVVLTIASLALADRRHRHPSWYDPRTAKVTAPELGAGAAPAGLVLLVGGALVFLDRRRTQRSG